MHGWRLLAILGLVILILVGVGLIGMEGWVSYQCRAAEKALERQDYKEARAHYLKALTFRPWSADLHLKVARLSRQIGETEEDYKQAEEHLEKCHRLLKGDVTEDYQLERLMLKAEMGEASERFNDLIGYVEKDRPEAPLVLEALCKGFLRVQQTSTAHQLVLKWLEKEPDNVHARMTRGLCIASLGNPMEAIRDFRYGLKRFPNNDVW